MCGILALLLRNNNTLSRELKQHMLEMARKLRHRGPDNDDLKNDMQKGINIVYMNHVNNNIKSIVDDYVNIQMLNERMESINNDLMLRLHKNKKYSTDGGMTFV